MDSSQVKTSVRSAFWDYLALLSGRGLTYPVLAGVMALWTRLLKEEGYGRFMTYLMVGQLFFLLGINWSAQAVNRFGREEYLQTGRMGRTFWSRNIILGICLVISAVVIVVFRRPMLGYIGIPQMSVGLLILTVLTLAGEDYASRVLQAQSKLKIFAFSAAIAHGVTLALLVMLAALQPSNIMLWVILAYLAGRWATAAYGFFFAGAPAVVPLRTESEHTHRLWVYSYPLIVGSACNYLVQWGPVMAVKHYLTDAQVGSFGLANQGISALRLVPLTLTSLALPLVLTFRVDRRDDLTRRYIDTIIPGVGFLWCVSLVPVVFAARYLIPLLFTRDFSASVLPFQVLCISLAFNVFNCMYAAVYLNYDITRQATMVNMVLAGLSLGGAWLLVPWLGPTGAAWASSSAFVVSGFLNMFICQKRLGMRRYGQVFLTLPVIVYVVLTAWTDSLWINLVVLAGVLAGSLIAARLFRLYRSEDLQLFEEVHMPGPVRRLMLLGYRLLGAKPVQGAN